MKKYLFVFILCALFSCKNTPADVFKNQAAGGVFGTSYSIVYLSDTSLDYQREIDSVFKVVNQSLSTYIPDSDISKINHGDNTVKVDHMFKDVFELSQEIFKNTNGYFDPTVGSLVNAWGFGPEEELEMNQVRVDSLLQLVGFNKVSISSKGTILKEDTRIYFDFNAIAKGYAIDRVAVLLDGKGIKNYLIEIGGEIVAKGQNTLKEKPWAVGIDNPENDKKRELKAVVNLVDRALASSGNYRKYRVDEETGEKFVHTIDPITGYARNSTTLGVTILADNCAIADGYATAFMAMDLEAAKKIILADRSMDAYIIFSDDQGEIQEFLTDGFKEVIVE